MDEQTIIRTLRNLPVAVTITPRPGRYIWWCVERGGSSDNLAGAMAAGLSAFVEQVVEDARVLDDIKNNHDIKRNQP